MQNRRCISVCPREESGGGEILPFFRKKRKKTVLRLDIANDGKYSKHDFDNHHFLTYFEGDLEKWLFLDAQKIRHFR